MCVVKCCSVLQCVAVCCSVLQYDNICMTSAGVYVLCISMYVYQFTGTNVCS